MKDYKFINDLKSGKFALMVKEEMTGEILNNSQEVFNVMRPIFGNTDVEMMYCIFLDSRNRVRSIELTSEGTLNASYVYPREIIKRALAVKAAAVIMVHNHPSGDPKPSPEDKAITKVMCVACRSVGITLHEHLICGNDTLYSFADHGEIARISRDYNQFMS